MVRRGRGGGRAHRGKGGGAKKKRKRPSARRTHKRRPVRGLGEVWGARLVGAQRVPPAAPLALLGRAVELQVEGRELRREVRRRAVDHVRHAVGAQRVPVVGGAKGADKEAEGLRAAAARGQAHDLVHVALVLEARDARVQLRRHRHRRGAAAAVVHGRGRPLRAPFLQRYCSRALCCSALPAALRHTGMRDGRTRILETC